MIATKNHTLRVPGATLHYTTSGAGPVLLVLQGGAGGAEGAEGIASHLAEQFTVVSYDRRGLSRSPMDGPPEQPPRLEVHADDAHHLLAAVTSEPAYALGVSIGALIGLDLVTRYPSQVRALVAYEPPADELLSEAQREVVAPMRQAIRAAYQKEGAAAAMRTFVMELGIAQEEREPEISVPRPSAAMAANVEFFFAHDAEAVERYRLNLPALAASPARIVPGVGRSSRIGLEEGRPGALLKTGPALALAARLGVPVVEFPGGHGAYASMPKAFSAKLREVLQGERG